MKTRLKNILTSIAGILTIMLTVQSCKNASSGISEQEVLPGIILENMDTLVSPKEDFYNYVNGT